MVLILLMAGYWDGLFVCSLEAFVSFSYSTFFESMGFVRILEVNFSFIFFEAIIGLLGSFIVLLFSIEFPFFKIDFGEFGVNLLLKVGSFSYNLILVLTSWFKPVNLGEVITLFGESSFSSFSSFSSLTGYPFTFGLVY